jgi:hypothetical protein
MAVTSRRSRGNDVEKLQQIFSVLEIELSRNPDGCFTVWSNSEPFFCFVRPTEKEIDTVVIDTLTSYLTNFWDVRTVNAAVASTVLNKPTIPVERVEPFSRIKPTFNVKDSQGRQLELA